jgi:hypothetical protein
MYQNVVLSPTVLQMLPSLEPAKRTNMLFQLLTETLLADSGGILLKEYDNVINGLPAKFKWIREGMFADLMERARPNVNVTVKVRQPEEYYSLDSEVLIVRRDECRVALANTSENIIQRLLYESDVEVCGCDDYLYPKRESRVRTVETHNVAKGQVFDLRKWLSKYLLRSSVIAIQDGYLCKKAAYEDIKAVLMTTDRAARIAIVTLDDSYQGPGVEDKLETLKRSLAPRDLSWMIERDKSNLRERYIQTDHFLIQISHALGSVDPGTQTVKSEFLLSVNLSPR